MGFKLTRFLSLLTSSAEQIAKNDQAIIPSFKDSSPEITILANALRTMQERIAQRNLELETDAKEREKSEQTIRTVLNSPLNSIVLISVDETILELNDIAARGLNSTVDKIKGKKLYDFSSDENSAKRKEHIDEMLTDKKPVVYERYTDKNIYKNYLYPIVDKKGKVVQISIFSHDITELTKVQDKINKYVKLIDENILISRIDLKGIITSNSTAFCRFTGYSCEELIGKEFDILRDPETPASLYEGLWKTIKNGKVWHGEVKNRNKDNRPYWVDASIYPDLDSEGKIVGYYVIRQDITDKKTLEKLSITDSLTKLYNRRYFNDIFDKEMNKARRDRKIFCLLSLDVDNFKLYNDNYGHQEGDNILFRIAKVLKENMKRAGDTAFRIGGEEFSAIYSVNDKKSVFTLAQKIRKLIQDEKIEHKFNSASSYVTASFGVAYVNFEKNVNAQVDKDILYKFTDNLLYEAKDSGKNIVVFKEFEGNLKLRG